MKKLTTILLTLLSLTSFSQSVETITEKISNKICDCIRDDIKSYSEIKPEFNRCYDKEFNLIFNIVDSSEQKILLQTGALNEVKNRLITTLNVNCKKIRNIIQSEITNSIEPSNKNPCPTNFEGKDEDEIEQLNREIIAFNGLVTEVYTFNKKPYYQIKLEGGNTMWIASLVSSGYEKKGKVLRILGYVSEVGDDKAAKEYNKAKYHILAFCVIDLESQQMSMFPGSERQVKEWISGKIPKATQ